jgi:alanine racemase
MANSAALLTNPASHFDLVRPGVTIYGLNPVPDRVDSRDLGLRPAMTLLARVANVKRLAAGQGIAYGHSYVTARPTTVALLPLGYADGLPWQASNVGPVLLAGQRRTVSGRISMDQITVDFDADNQHNPDDLREPLDPTPLTDVAERLDVQPGDVAVLFGAGPGAPSAADWAEAAGTIDYEIVSRIGARVPRIYVGTAGREDVEPGRSVEAGRLVQDGGPSDG